MVLNSLFVILGDSNLVCGVRLSVRRSGDSIYNRSVLISRICVDYHWLAVCWQHTGLVTDCLTKGKTGLSIRNIAFTGGTLVRDYLADPLHTVLDHTGLKGSVPSYSFGVTSVPLHLK